MEEDVLTSVVVWMERVRFLSRLRNDCHCYILLGEKMKIKWEFVQMKQSGTWEEVQMKKIILINGNVLFNRINCPFQSETVPLSFVFHLIEQISKYCKSHRKLLFKNHNKKKSIIFVGWSKLKISQEITIFQRKKLLKIWMKIEQRFAKSSKIFYFPSIPFLFWVWMWRAMILSEISYLVSLKEVMSFPNNTKNLQSFSYFLNFPHALSTFTQHFYQIDQLWIIG